MVRIIKEGWLKSINCPEFNQYNEMLANEI